MGRTVPAQGATSYSSGPLADRQTTMIQRNLSTPDRLIRIVLGVLMLAAGWSGFAEGIWRIALQVFGWVPLATGLLGWCPVYALLGFSTFKSRNRRPPVL